MQERQILIEELTNNLKTIRGDLTAVCKVYAIAKALEEEIISTANKCKSQVLAEKCYYRSPEMSKLMGENTPQRVTDPEDIPEISREYWNEIFTKAYELYKQHGIDDPRGADYIPEARARDLRFKAEDCLIDTFAALIPSMFTAEDIRDIKRHLLHRRKFIEIAMNAGLAAEKEA